ncbi:hypothetical protein [Streptomyces sp. NPDC057910]|uniref:hypothetical protein n=1 Tax=Streptomyces sp. NPDC057910 TaxID=3346278 RepID=UPI0036E95F97
MSTSDQEQAVGAAPEERRASHAAEATVPGQASKASKRPSGERGAAAEGDPRGTEADAGAAQSAGRAEGPSAAEAAEAAEPADAAEPAEPAGPEGGRAEPTGAAELPDAGAPVAAVAAENAVRPASSGAVQGGGSGKDAGSGNDAGSGVAVTTGESEPASAERAEARGSSHSADPAAPGRPEQAESAQLPQKSGDFAEAGNGAEAKAEGEVEGEVEGEPEVRQGMAPWKARRVRMVAAGVLMAAMGVILVVRLATRSSVLVVGVYGLALILCGVVIELSRNGRTRLGSWLLVVGLAAAFGMDWFVLP